MAHKQLAVQEILEKKDDKLLDNAQVIVRIIDINGNKSLIKHITKANNRQNKIDGIDFAS